MQNAVVHSPTELVQYLHHLRGSFKGCPVLVQEFLPGAEYSVGLVGNPGFELRALPILTVDYSSLDPSLPPILGYESKWISDSPYWKQVQYRKADLGPELERTLQDNSRRLFERLQCRDYARFDFRTDDAGTIKLLEVNPNPGWCWDGKLNLMASFAGISYSQLLGMILKAAEARHTMSGPLPAVADEAA